MERKLLLPIDIRTPNKETNKLKWLASQTPAVIELSKDLYRQIRPFCTDKTCRKMTAGKYEYQWKHHPRSKKPRSYAAQYYLKMMFQWINQQKHIFEMESNRHDRLVRHMGEEDLDEPILHPLFRKDSNIRVLIADYLHDPFYYLTGIWAKAFSVYAHIFCQHFGNEELSPEVKSYVETSFERFMRFVKGYRILSTRRLAPLDKRIAKIDFKSLGLPSSPLSPNLPRESKSIIFNKTLTGGMRPSVMNASLMQKEESTTASLQTGVLLRSDSFGYASDPEQLVEDEPGREVEDEPGREGERDDYDFRARAPTQTSGNGLDTSARIIDRTEDATLDT